MEMSKLFCRRASASQENATVERLWYWCETLLCQDERRRDSVEASRYEVKIRNRVEWSLENVLDVQSMIEGIGSVRGDKQ